MERWNGGTVERWNGGKVERWNGGTVERWNGGTVDRWNGGTVERWKILYGVKSEHIVRFQAVYMEPCAMILEYLFFDFAPFGGSEIVSSLDRLLQYIFTLMRQSTNFHFEKRSPSKRL